MLTTSTHNNGYTYEPGGWAHRGRLHQAATVVTPPLVLRQHPTLSDYLKHTALGTGHWRQRGGLVAPRASTAQSRPLRTRELFVAPRSSRMPPPPSSSAVAAAAAATAAVAAAAAAAAATVRASRANAPRWHDSHGAPRCRDTGAGRGESVLQQLHSEQQQQQQQRDMAEFARQSWWFLGATDSNIAPRPTRPTKKPAHALGEGGAVGVAARRWQVASARVLVARRLSSENVLVLLGSRERRSSIAPAIRT